MRYLRILNTKVLDTKLMHGFCAYNGKLYGVTWDYPAKLAKIEPSDLSYTLVTLESDYGNDIKPAKGYLWAITYMHRGVKLYRIDPTDLSYTIFTWPWARDGGLDYPNSLVYDNDNTLYIGGNVGGILKIDISDVDNPVGTRIATPTIAPYYHHVMVWNAETKKLTLYGIDQVYYDWDDLYNSNKYLHIYDPSDDTIISKKIDYGCTDDGTAVGKFAYFVVESIPGKTPWPRTIYKVDTETGEVTTFQLDETLLSPFADGIYYYDGKLLVSYRGTTTRNGTIVTLNPDFTDIEYFSTVYDDTDLAPDEIAKIGNIYYGTSQFNRIRRVFAFDFYEKACSEYETQEDCEAAGCYWWSDETCRDEPEKSCEDYTNQEECEAAGCYWYEGSCHTDPYTTPCSSYTDPDTCYDNGCYWWGNACHDIPLDCSAITNMTDCISAGCYWYDGACHAEAPPSCEDFTDEYACEAAGCYWYNGSCHTDPATCPDYDNQEDCEAAGCYWYDNSCHSTPPTPTPTPTPTPIPPPVAVIDSIDPNLAYSGDTVTFRGHGVTTGSILEYEWTSNLTGLLSKYATFTKSDLPVGTHNISFRVRDDLYGWSDPATDTLVIQELPACEQWSTKAECEAHNCYWYNGSCHANPAECKDYDNKEECEAAGCYWYDNSCHSSPQSVIPVATIESINPNPAGEGEPVTFEGSGYDPDGGVITGYEWTSDIVGILSNYRTFTRSDLPAGTHTISFRVRDDEQDWSEPATDTLVITAAPTPTPTPTATPTPTTTPTPTLPPITGECVLPRILTGTLTPRLERGVIFYRARCIIDKWGSRIVPHATRRR